ncbi:MAG TPA: hypothetical protein VGQ83_22430 [Polyangia bacterium]
MPSRKQTPPDETPRPRVDLNLILGFRDDPGYPLLEPPREHHIRTLRLVQTAPPRRAAAPTRWSVRRLAALVFLVVVLIVGSLVAIFEGRTKVFDNRVELAPAAPLARAAALAAPTG